MDVDQQKIELFVNKVPQRTRILFLITLACFPLMAVVAVFLSVDPLLMIVVLSGALFGCVCLFRRHFQKKMAGVAS
jgi:hypothetical protein